MIKKITSLLLCGLISFSLVGMAPAPVIHCDSDGKPIQPSKREKVVTHVKIIAPVAFLCGLGAAVNSFGLVKLVDSANKDSLGRMISIGAATILLNGCIKGALEIATLYATNQNTIASQKNINIKHWLKPTIGLPFVAMGLVTGAYCGIRWNK